MSFLFCPITWLLMICVPADPISRAVIFIVVYIYSSVLIGSVGLAHKKNRIRNIDIRILTTLIGSAQH